jgi:hypothetical protein
MFKRQRSICMIFGLVITALLATSGTVGARQGEADTEIWYWAYNDSQIIAYTLDGQSRVIYEAEGAFVDRRLEGLRLSPERAWLLDNYNQNFPPLLDSHGALSPLGAGVYPQVYEHPYLVVAQIGFNPREGFVYNMETQEIRQLTDRLVRNYYADGQHQTPRFLADGHTLRYYSVNEASLEASNKGTLWELDLLTGNELHYSVFLL